MILAVRRDPEVLLHEASRVEELGMSVVRRDVRRFRAAMIKAYSTHLPTDPIVRAYSSLLGQRLLEGMVSAHAYGEVRTQMVAARRKRERISFSTLDATLDFLQERTGLSQAKLKLLSKQYEGQALSATGKLLGRTERSVQEALQEIIGKGLHVREGVAELRRALDSIGLTLDEPWALTTIYRTQSQIAYNAGRWKASQLPDVQEILWGYEYVTVGDDRVRAEHEGMDGARYPKDDPIWKEIWPPNGYNCRCSTIEIFLEDAEAETRRYDPIIRVGGEDIFVGPDAGFKINFAEAIRLVA